MLKIDLTLNVHQKNFIGNSWVHNISLSSRKILIQQNILSRHKTNELYTSVVDDIIRKYSKWSEKGVWWNKHSSCGHTIKCVHVYTFVCVILISVWYWKHHILNLFWLMIWRAELIKFDSKVQIAKISSLLSQLYLLGS